MKEIQVPQYNNQPVATLGVLADYLGTSKKTLQGNLAKNPDKFNHGKHYFNISHDNLKSTTSRLGEVFDYKGNTGLQVWTERGCARLSKLLRTDEAWDLWELMEDSYFNSKPQIPKSFSEALLLAGKLEQEKEQALLERDVAIKTKAEIGNRREATAMNTAAQAVKKSNKLEIEVDKLEIELDKSKEWSTVIIMKQFNPDCDFEGLSNNKIGKEMSKYCRDNGFEIKKITEENIRYEIGTYPKKAWKDRFDVER